MSTTRPRRTTKRYLRTRAPEQNPAPQRKQPLQTPGAGPWARRKIRPLFLSWFQPHRPYDQRESFFPFPKVTFLIDHPAKLECQICRLVCCEIKSDIESTDDTTFSMLPCGHAACSQCLETWLRAHDYCPFCRVNLSYSGCGHQVPARALTKEGLHLLPRTLPDQGRIPHLCAQCLKQTLLEGAAARFRQATREFEEARRTFYRTGAATDEEVMLAKRDEFETVLWDKVYRPQLSTWLTSW